MHRARSKIFGGRPYYLHKVLRGDRSDADREARALRANGQLVRVLRVCIRRRWHGRSEWGYALYHHQPR